MSGNVVALLYLVAGVLFILALRGLSNPETSRQGNLFGIAGMGIAIVTTLAASPPAGAIGWALVVGGLAIGGGVGAVIARQIAMTAMPQLRVPLARRTRGGAGRRRCALRATSLRHRRARRNSRPEPRRNVDRHRDR